MGDQLVIGLTNLIVGSYGLEGSYATSRYDMPERGAHSPLGPSENFL